MKQKTKGVISVFLLIIFMSIYMATGLMVDYGRIKMAKATVSMSADQAAESVLSYYDEMLLEMYGLFALDNSNTEKIQEIFETYLTKTLLISGTYSDEHVKQISDSVFAAIEGSKYFDGYNFNIDEIKVDSSYNLSYTDVTKAQILETMKYRAPYEMLTSEDGFLNKLVGIVKIKDIIDAYKEYKEIQKNYSEIEKDYKKLKNEYDEIMKKIDKKLDGGINKKIDDIKKIIKDYDNDLMEYSEDDSSEENTEEQEEKPTKEEVIKHNKEIVDNMIEAIRRETYVNINDITALIPKLEKNIVKYAEFIGKLEEKIKNETNEEKKSVFKSNLIFAKINCGCMIHDKELLEIYKEVSDLIEDSLIYIKNNAYDHVDKLEHFASEADEYMDRIENAMDILYAKQFIFRYKSEEENKKIAENIGKELNDKAKQKFKEMPEWFLNDYTSDKVDFEGAVGYYVSEENIENSEVMPDFDNFSFDAIFNAGEIFINSIGGFLIDSTNNIYINEYIMQNFANVVHQRNMKDKNPPIGIDSDKDNKDAIDNKLADKVYNVSEIEYILTGEEASELSVVEIYGQILGIRILFNTIAIFTDPAKMELAASISGPWAPLLLVGWAVAESTIDVINLQNGYKVMLFKRGNDWTISKGGVVTGIANYGVSEVVSLSMSATDILTEKVKGKINVFLYDIRQKNTGNINEFSEDMAQLTAQIPGFEEHGEELIQDYNNILNTAGDVLQSSLIIKLEELQEKYTLAAGNHIQALGEEKLKGLTEKISNVLPAGMSEAGSTSEIFKIKMGYGDYLRFLLLLKPENEKLENLQKIIQVNMKQNNDKSFTMEKAITNVYSDIKISMKYIFMTKTFIKQSGVEGNRYQLKIMTNKGY